jgi:hypothetical protein
MLDPSMPPWGILAEWPGTDKSGEREGRRIAKLKLKNAKGREGKSCRAIGDLHADT